MIEPETSELINFLATSASTFVREAIANREHRTGEDLRWLDAWADSVERVVVNQGIAFLKDPETTPPAAEWTAAELERTRDAERTIVYRRSLGERR